MSREAMQMALDAFDYFFPTEDGQLWHTANDVKKIDDARQALQQALEKEQEPVECMCGICKLGKRDLTCVCGAVWEGETMVHPPREREWVGLTDQEIEDLWNQHERRFDFYSFSCDIEAKLKEKNHG